MHWNPSALGQQTPAAQATLLGSMPSRQPSRKSKRKSSTRLRTSASRSRKRASSAGSSRRSKRKPARLVKGSRAAKAYMAKIRRMRRR